MREEHSGAVGSGACGAECVRQVPYALEHEEFLLYLQFLVDARSHAIVGAEALSRWMHPEKGLLMPGGYIAQMERERVVSRLDYYVLERTCRVLETLHGRGVQDFFLSCNFSRDTFADTEFLRRCGEIIGRHRFPRGMLVLEVTETGRSNETAAVYRNAAGLREHGVRVALDDYGAGYAGDADLYSRRFDLVKLDKSLTDAVGTPEGERRLSRVVSAGHRLGLTVLAEGAETARQVDKLTALGCDVIQGFYFYRPLPAREAVGYYLARAC